MGSIRFDKVDKLFGGAVKALDNINLEIAEKEFVAIVGPSGCGKTTCLRMVAGFEAASAGVVSVNGKPITAPGPDRAVVFQQFALFPWKTVRENIDLGLRNKNLPASERDGLIAGALKLMNLESHAQAYPHQLSGGMQQRVAIARAYVLDPDVLLMDEPFGALDAQTRVVMQEELVRLARRNPRTVLFHHARGGGGRLSRRPRRDHDPQAWAHQGGARHQEHPRARELGPACQDRGRDGPRELRPPAHAYLEVAARGEGAARCLSPTARSEFSPATSLSRNRFRRRASRARSS
jgi:NitT/TauT family transport system ATP-binding protein